MPPLLDFLINSPKVLAIPAAFSVLLFLSLINRLLMFISKLLINMWRRLRIWAKAALGYGIRSGTLN